MRVSPFVGERRTSNGFVHKKVRSQGETEELDRNTTFISHRPAPLQTREDTTGHGRGRTISLKFTSATATSASETYSAPNSILKDVKVKCARCEGNNMISENVGKQISDTQEQQIPDNVQAVSLKPLKSSLKQRSQVKPRGATRRRIRGLWMEGESDQFSLLHDSTLQHILSYLAMNDIVSLSFVSNRWRQLSLHPSCWKHVDATEFLAMAQRRLKAPPKDAAKKIAPALRGYLEKYSPESLTIRSIQELLNPEDYLPSVNGLCELVLTRFQALSDTHVHVMLLSASELEVRARSKSSSSIRKLALEYCPLLTNGSLRSIASQCRQLEEVSLCGCANISDISSLRPLLKINTVTDASSAKGEKSGIQALFAPPPAAPPNKQPSHLASLFAPQPPVSQSMNSSANASQLASMFQAPASTGSFSSSDTASTGLFSLFDNPGEKAAPKQSSGLASLFEPVDSTRPGEKLEPKQPGLASLFEPPKTSGTSFSISNLSSTTTITVGGLLTRLDFSFTSLKAASFVNMVESKPGKIALESLLVRGSGESWADDRIGVLSSCPWRCIDICCSDLKLGSNRLTDEGFRVLDLKQCVKLSIAGQKGIHIASLARALNTAKKLQSLDAEQCSSLFMGDEASTVMMVHSVQNSTTLKYVNVAGCFSNEERAGDTGKRFLQAICTSASRWTLRELDLRHCWFVTASEVAKVRRACPRLERLHLFGTRCNEVI